jgi:hypothetical protein
MFFTSTYENRIIMPLKFFKKGMGKERVMEG